MVQLQLKFKWIIYVFELIVFVLICIQWIFDQHAIDERFNFEKLCENTVIHEQNLIAPLPLELSVSEEDCVLENLDVFRKNGFKLSYDENEAPRHRVSVLAIPHSGSGSDGRKAVQFGKDEIGAILYMLGAEGCFSSEGYSKNSGTGTDGVCGTDEATFAEVD